MSPLNYRESEYRERCQVCRQEAALHCLRCGLPLCERHVPPDESRCDDCEDKFLALRLSHELTGRVWEPNTGATLASMGLTLVLIVAILVVLLVSRFIGFYVTMVYIGGLTAAWMLALRGIRGLSDGTEVKSQLAKSRELFLAERSGDKASTGQTTED